MKDPYYRRILEGLAGPLDRDEFEACAVDLLQDTYPGLVPIHGGQDRGMDGAIFDGEGEAYSLVSTTGQDVSGNLRKSLESYRAQGGTRNRVVLATSQALTSRRRQNLEERARERGFVLVQIHDRRDFAARLYRNSRWAKELLGLTGEPSALSAVPLARRPLREDLELIGRDADLAWLVETPGDKLLVGQPGMGKTHLLLQLVRQGGALFLTSEDEGAITAALRDLQPRMVLVDDAHTAPETLVRLRRLRRDEEVRAEFDLVATAWPGTEDDVRDALGTLSTSNVRELEGLTRRQIVQVLRGVGVDAPDDDPHLGVLVNQSANKPGLAVTLGTLWQRGEWREVLTGQAIRRSLIPALKRVVGADLTDLLACFALGGSRGLEVEIVRGFLELDRGTMRRRTAVASQGGVLRVVDPQENSRLVVEPEVLRSALLQEVFFPEAAPSLDYRPLLEQARYPPEAVETLVWAALRRVPVSRDKLRVLVEKHGTQASWELLAQLGEEEGRWVLEHWPGALVEVARAALETTPRAAITKLLEAAVEIDQPRHASSAIGTLLAWSQEIPFVPGRSSDRYPQQSVRRKQLIIEVVLEQLKSEISREKQVVQLEVALDALSPRLETVRWVVTGGAITTHSATLPPSVVPTILDLWTRLAEHLEDHLDAVWPRLTAAIGAWSDFPGMSDSGHVDQLRQVARQMLRDLKVHAKDRLGLASALQMMGRRIDLDLGLVLDEEFDVLYPASLTEGTGREGQRTLEQEEEGGRQLATAWASCSSAAVSRKLALFEQEVRTFSRGRSRAAWALSTVLSEAVGSPVEWGACFVARGLDATYVRPFLQRAVDERFPGWLEFLRGCLQSSQYSGFAAEIALQMDDAPQELLEDVLSVVELSAVETLCLRGRVPRPNLELLLRHSNEELALAAVVGTWWAEPKGAVSTEIQDDWRRAVLRIGGTIEVDQLPEAGLVYCLEAILLSDAELAFEWLQARLRDAGEYKVVYDTSVFRTATQALNEKQRRQLLQALEPHRLGCRLAPWLVGNDIGLYSCLLERDDLRSEHLEPLSTGLFGHRWADAAQLALESGHEPEEIALAVVWPAHSGAGHGVDRWSVWKETFESLLSDPRESLRSIAEHGLGIAEEELTKAKTSARRFELTGHF